MVVFKAIHVFSKVYVITINIKYFALSFLFYIKNG